MRSSFISTAHASTSSFEYDLSCCPMCLCNMLSDTCGVLPCAPALAYKKDLFRVSPVYEYDTRLYRLCDNQGIVI